jgi:hypothetical protein
MKLPLYFIVGARPVKAIQTPDGGMDVLALDWDTGEFSRHLEYTSRIMVVTDVEVEEVSESEFNAVVEKLKAESRQKKST